MGPSGERGGGPATGLYPSPPCFDWAIGGGVAVERRMVGACGEGQAMEGFRRGKREKQIGRGEKINN